MCVELRKVQQTRTGTFFVCLPKSWAGRQGLQKGSVVAMSEVSDGGLLVDPKYNVEKALSVVTLKPSEYLDREITGKYLFGYDIIKVEAKGRIIPKNRARVKEAINRLVGLEIVEEDYSKVVMQCLLEPSSFPPEKILRREYSIACGMHRDTVKALVEGDIHLAKNVIARDNEVNRLYFLLVCILRTVIQNPNLSEKLNIKPIDCLDYRLTASLVELIGDQSVRIALKVADMRGEKLQKELVTLILKFNEAVYLAHEKALQALFTHNVPLAESVRELREKITSNFVEIERTVKTQPAETASVLFAAASAVNRIYDHSVDIADLVMPRIA